VPDQIPDSTPRKLGPPELGPPEHRPMGGGSTDAVTMNPGIASLGFLLGRWRGEGEGSYPTVEPFGYSEESVYWHVGGPFIGYRQRTWRRDGRPSHSESGYWRCPGPGRVELVVAHANGTVEVSEGHVVGAALTMTSTVMAGTSTAKEVTAISRRLAVDGDACDYTLDMAGVGVPLTFHLVARLRRVARGETV